MHNPESNSGLLPLTCLMFVTVNRLVAGLFIVLLAGAAFFYMERMLFLDASFILFRIINLGEFQIQEHRYGSFITQAFPLIAAKLHLPIQVVVLLVRDEGGAGEAAEAVVAQLKASGV